MRWNLRATNYHVLIQYSITSIKMFANILNAVFYNSILEHTWITIL